MTAFFVFIISVYGDIIEVEILECICAKFTRYLIEKRMEVVNMPIVQVPLDVPDDIYMGVLNGSLELLGMVKDGQHKVRKHIPRAKLPKADKAAKVKKAGVWQVIKEHKAVAIGIGAVAAVAGVGAYVYHDWKDSKRQAAEERIAGFQKALKDYLKASKKGKLNAKVVDNLLNALDDLEKKKLGKDVELTIPASQLTALIYSIFTYTETLAKANEYDVKIAKPKNGTQGSITSLKSYLEIQKEILENAA